VSIEMFGGCRGGWLIGTSKYAKGHGANDSILPLTKPLAKTLPPYMVPKG